MSDPDLISEEHLNALIDHELDDKERKRVLIAIDQNPALRAQYNELLSLKNLISTAYRDIPTAPIQPEIPKPMYRYFLGLASAALILLGVSIGWTINANMNEISHLNFKYVEKLDTSIIDGHKILLHINTSDPRRVRASLQWAENLLEYNRSKHTHLDLEIVVNAEGLNILRSESPYAQEIATLSKEFNNLTFLACGMAKQNAMLKENKKITLLPEAKDIPAALDQIVNRLQEGWIYLRG